MRCFHTADNAYHEYIQSGGTGSPLYGLSVEINNPLYIEDNTAPVMSNLEVSIIEEDGKLYLQLTGTAEDPNLSTLWFYFNAV